GHSFEDARPQPSVSDLVKSHLRARNGANQSSNQLSHVPRSGEDQGRSGGRSGAGFLYLGRWFFFFIWGNAGQSLDRSCVAEGRYHLPETRFLRARYGRLGGRESRPGSPV